MVTTADGGSHLEDVVVNKPLRNGDLLRDDHNVLQILIRHVMQLLAVVCTARGFRGDDPRSQQ